MAKSITTSVTWHPGGAQRGDDGEPVPWPWGENRMSPEDMRYVYRSDAGEVFTHEQSIWATSWPRILCYCNPADLEAPDFAKGDADGTG